MQEEKQQNLAFLYAVSEIRLTRGWTWDDVAKQLGVSRTMLHFIRKGKHNVTDKIQYKLEQLQKKLFSESVAAVQKGERAMTTEEERLLYSCARNWVQNVLKSCTDSTEKMRFLTCVLDVVNEQLKAIELPKRK